MLEKLDLKDRKILHELDINCRQHNSQLAKKVGLSKDSITYRISQLEKKRIITSYRAIIDFSKLGFLHFRVALKLVNINEDNLNKLIVDLKRENMVWVIGQNEGVWDMAFTCLVKSHLQFYEFYEKLMQRHKQIIKDKLISQILKYDEVERSYIINRKKSIKHNITFNNKIETIDELDHNLIIKLSSNARIKLIELAKELNISSMLVHQRIKQLEKKKIITGYKANINVIELGRDYYGIKITLDNYSQKKEILEEIYSIPEMTAVIYTVAGYDIEFDLEVKNTQEYYKILNKLRNKFSSIREVEYMRAMKYYKLDHFPK